MRGLSAIRTKKVLVSSGAWHTGAITHSEFPLSHVHKLRLSKAWNWCVVDAEGGGQQYKVLVAFDPGKRQYWAWLGAVFGSDQAVVARVEFHASHDGWHCHWKTGALVDVPRGAVKASGKGELRHGCSGDPPDVSKLDAFKVAFKLFNVHHDVGFVFGS